MCPDHAYNIPPNIVSVTWHLGKKCNYDCSYCSPHTHDAVSPFMCIDTALRFVDDFHQHCDSESKKTKWSITGGEPFLDPNFFPLVQHVKSKHSTAQMNVTSNGSLPIEQYCRATEFFDGITISLHLERPPSEIEKIIKDLHKIKNCFVSVNLMALPGRLLQIKKIVKQLQDQNVHFMVRKITPAIENTALLPFESVGAGKKNRQLFELQHQSNLKFLYKHEIDSQRSHRLLEFYSAEENDYLAHINHAPTWINCGYWDVNGEYLETNTDYLVGNDMNQFHGWTCYAGVDQIYIDFDGSIYRGICMNGGAIGHIRRAFSMASQPTSCDQKWCICGNDICVRKSVQSHSQYVTGTSMIAMPGQEHYVNGNEST